MSEMMLRFTKHPSGARVRTLTKSQNFNPMRSSSQNLAASTYPTLASASRSKMAFDVLEHHSDKFTAPEKPFQPRINKRSSSKSKLATDLNASYQPPRSRTASARGSVASTARTVNDDQAANSSEFMKGEEADGARPRRKSPNKSVKSFEDDDEDFEDNAEYLNKYKNKMNNSGLNESLNNRSPNKSLNDSRKYTVAAAVPISKSRQSKAKSSEE
jgi:hypothetical protein